MIPTSHFLLILACMLDGVSMANLIFVLNLQDWNGSSTILVIKDPVLKRKKQFYMIPVFISFFTCLLAKETMQPSPTCTYARHLVNNIL